MQSNIRCEKTKLLSLVLDPLLKKSNILLITLYSFQKSYNNFTFFPMPKVICYITRYITFRYIPQS